MKREGVRGCSAMLLKRGYDVTVAVSLRQALQNDFVAIIEEFGKIESTQGALPWQPYILHFLVRL